MARTVYINVSLTEPPFSDLILAAVTPNGGSNSSDQTFVESFMNSSTVNVTHNLNKRPSVTIIDSAGDEVDSTVNHVSLAFLTVTFSAPFSGQIICN